MQPGDIVEANIVGGLNPVAGSPVANATRNALNRLGLTLCWSNESKHQRKCPAHRKIHQLLRWCKDESWIFGDDHSFRSHVSVYLVSRDTGSFLPHNLLKVGCFPNSVGRYPLPLKKKKVALSLIKIMSPSGAKFR